MKLSARIARLSIATALVAACAVPAAAQDRRVADAGKAAAQLKQGVEQKAFGGLQAPNARLAGLFRAGGQPVRTKGVDSITRIDTGVYCIRPSSAMDVSKIVVSLTVEYSYSDVTEAMVQWAEGLSGCGAGRIGVYTFADNNQNANYSYSNDVAFAIVVP